MARIDATDLRATIDGVRYQWGGGFGSVLTSFERGVKRRQVRIIGGELFCAYRVYPYFFWSEICWVPCRDVGAEWIRHFKAAVFLGEPVPASDQ